MVKKECLWAICAVTNQDEKILQEFIAMDEDNFLIRHLVQMAIEEDKLDLLVPVLKCLGGVIASSDNQLV